MIKMKTKEEMAVMREKATASRKEKLLALKSQEHLYKLDYLDSNHWQELATKYKIRMPQYNVPATASGIRRYLKKCGLEKEDWEDAFGKMKDWIEMNPTWTAYASVGLILEMKHARNS